MKLPFASLYPQAGFEQKTVDASIVNDDEDNKPVSPSTNDGHAAATSAV